MVTIECPWVFAVHAVHSFKSGIERELGDCKCSVREPEGRDRDQCVCVGAYTGHHHHVVDGLWFVAVFMIDGFWFIS